MKEIFRESCKDYLIWHFRKVPVPDSLRSLLISGEPVTLVTHSDALVMEALLTALARAAGAPDPVHVRAALAAQAGSETASPPLTWCSVSNADLLAQWHALAPQRRFSSVNLFHVRGPVKNHPSYQSGVRAMWRLFLGARFMFIIFGDPISTTVGLLDDGTSSLTRPGDRLARVLKLDFYRNHKLIRGTPLQPIQTQASQILNGHDFERELQIIAQRAAKDIEQVRQQAFDEFYRMAANPRRLMYGMVAPIARFMLHRLFTNVRTFGIERFTAAVRDHPVVLVPMHRSHLDYVLLGTTLYHLNLNPPLVAAGVNLSFWPFGFIIRSLGGYFVKRDARHDRIHAMLLRRYVQYLLKRGHLQEFFIEGGRSRSGRMRAPKIGLLNIMVEAFLKRARKDVLFVPVSLTYEQLIEDKVFGDENTGQSKQKEDLRALVKARSIFRKQYGEVIMTFGEPVSLAEYCRNHTRTTTSSTDSPSKPVEQRAIVNDLAKSLTRSIRDNTHLTLTGLAHTALLNAPRYGLSRRELVEEITRLATVASALHERIPGIAMAPTAYTTSLQRFLDGNSAVLDDLLAGGIIQRSSVLHTDLFFIPGKKRFSAEFYKNSVIHFFFFAGVAAILELRDELITPGAIREFYPWFASEFFLPSPDELEVEFARALERLADTGLLTKESEGRTFRSGPAVRELCSPAMLLSFIESHLWVLLQLQALCSSGIAVQKDDRYTVSFSSLSRKLLEEFRSSAYLGFMTRTEASSQSNIQAVLDNLSGRKLLSSNGEGSKREITFVSPDPEEIKALASLQRLIVSYQAREALSSRDLVQPLPTDRGPGRPGFSHLN